MTSHSNIPVSYSTLPNKLHPSPKPHLALWEKFTTQCRTPSDGGV